MKALVLAGGSGTRLRPFSHSMPKQLIPVANRPVLEYVLENIAGVGVTDVGVVVGDRADQIAEAIGDGSRLGVRVTYLRQDRPLGLAHAVRLARPFLGDEDFVLYLGDNMLPDGIAGPAARFRDSRPAAQVLVQAVADPRRFGVVELSGDGAVRRLVEKPAHPTSDLAMLGAYFFTAAIHRAVSAIPASSRGEWEITDAVQWLVDRGAEVRAVEYDGFWMDIGRVEDVLECNRRLLTGLHPYVAGLVDADSEIGPNVVVEAGARVVRSRVVGPAIVGAHTVLEDSRVGPYVSIGRECLLRAAAVAESIVLDQASIVGGGMLHGSLIGRAAAVGHTPGGEPHHRMLVGDHARVHIAG
jgi:glucose-1-phosphate thymidylyltransferase